MFGDSYIFTVTKYKHRVQIKHLIGIKLISVFKLRSSLRAVLSLFIYQQKSSIIFIVYEIWAHLRAKQPKLLQYINICQPAFCHLACWYLFVSHYGQPILSFFSTNWLLLVKVSTRAFSVEREFVTSGGQQRRVCASLICNTHTYTQNTINHTHKHQNIKVHKVQLKQ